MFDAADLRDQPDYCRRPSNVRAPQCTVLASPGLLENRSLVYRNRPGCSVAFVISRITPPLRFAPSYSCTSMVV